MKIKKSVYLKHETKKSALYRYIGVVLVIIVYFIFMSLKYGIKQGIGVTILTWSAFVFCTPIADAGFLVDFPVRLLTKIKMIHSEMMVWIIAFFTVLYTLNFKPYLFEKNIFLHLYKEIITHPWPFWLIIILSLSGTFLSVYFGDELIDTVHHKDRKKFIKHKNKHKTIIFLFLFVIIISLYYYLLKQFNLNLF